VRVWFRNFLENDRLGDRQGNRRIIQKLISEKQVVRMRNALNWPIADFSVSCLEPWGFIIAESDVSHKGEWCRIQISNY